MQILDSVFSLLSVLKVSDPQTIGDIVVAKGYANWSSGHSARMQAQKNLNQLADLKKITKHQGYYRTLDCQSEYSDHAKLLTKCLAEIIKLPYNPTIYREHSFSNGMRADAAVYLKDRNRATCFILEVCHTETYEYLENKHREWLRQGPKALSELFQTDIPHFGFVVEGKEVGFAEPFKKIMEVLHEQ